MPNETLRIVLLVICAVVLATVFLLWPGKAKRAQKLPFYGRNIAHRGLHKKDKTVPENSMAAFAAAVRAGYAIELDIRLTKDAKVVVFHDDDLRRVCGAKGLVDDYTLEELRPLRLHGTREGVPLFTDVLNAVQGRVPLVIELKMGPKNRLLCEQAWAILRQYPGEYCIESFDPRMVRWFKKNAPGVLRGQLAAPPASLRAGTAGFLVGNLLTNVLCRPHFVAYALGPKTMLADLGASKAMRVGWTAQREEAAEAAQNSNDAVIFEFYTPSPVYKELPEEPKRRVW